jgi:hypothetical protein
MPKFKNMASTKTTLECQGEEEAYAQRPLAIIDELPRCAVDRRDVIGVKSVSHPEGVRQGAGAESKEPCF